MAAKGKVAPLAPFIRLRRGAAFGFIFAKILTLPPQRFLSIRLREISSFMISFVPP